MSEAQTVGQAVAEVSAPKMISPELFEQVLPAQVGAAKFTRWALTLLRRDDLAAVARTPAGQLSIVTALLDCASLGLEPGRTYHLVPFKGKVTGITDYKGEIQLITNADPGACVVAQLVRKADDFAMTGANIPPRHDADWFGDRGDDNRRVRVRRFRGRPVLAGVPHAGGRFRAAPGEGRGDGRVG